MKTTMTLAVNLGCSPFDIFNQDVDEVIMTINFYIILGEQEENTQTTAPTSKPVIKPKKEERIRVNDATATGGWW